jgi:hypothetical protein
MGKMFPGLFLKKMQNRARNLKIEVFSYDARLLPLNSSVYDECRRPRWDANERIN